LNLINKGYIPYLLLPHNAFNRPSTCLPARLTILLICHVKMAGRLYRTDSVSSQYGLNETQPIIESAPISVERSSKMKEYFMFPPLAPIYRTYANGIDVPTRPRLRRTDSVKNYIFEGTPYERRVPRNQNPGRIVNAIEKLAI